MGCRALVRRLAGQVAVFVAFTGEGEVRGSARPRP